MLRITGVDWDREIGFGGWIMRRIPDNERSDGAGAGEEGIDGRCFDEDGVDEGIDEVGFDKDGVDKATNGRGFDDNGVNRAVDEEGVDEEGVDVECFGARGFINEDTLRESLDEEGVSGGGVAMGEGKAARVGKEVERTI